MTEQLELQATVNIVNNKQLLYQMLLIRRFEEKICSSYCLNAAHTKRY